MRSYFNEDRLGDVKTGTLIGEARGIEFIQVDNEKEALALENNLIKQWKPRYNILLRDDKTYPYIKLTAEKYPRVYVTRRLRKDGATYFGPYFPGNLAHRLVHFIHRHFLVPSCNVDLTRTHTHPCLEFHIHRCLGPCVEGSDYGRALCRKRCAPCGCFWRAGTRIWRRSCASAWKRPVRPRDMRKPRRCTICCAPWRRWARSRKWRRPRAATPIFWRIYAEPPLVAANLFHLRHGHIVDRREFFWEDQMEFAPEEFVASLLKQVYLNEPYVPSFIHVPAEFEEREVLEEILSEKRGRKVEILHAAARAQEASAGSGGVQREA